MRKSHISANPQLFGSPLDCRLHALFSHSLSAGALPCPFTRHHDASNIWKILRVPFGAQNGNSLGHSGHSALPQARIAPGSLKYKRIYGRRCGRIFQLGTHDFLERRSFK